MKIFTIKCSLLTLLLATSFLCEAQKITILSGNIQGLDIGSKIYISQTAKSGRVDSFVVTSDSFTFKLNIQKGDMYLVSFYKNTERFDWPVYVQSGSNVILHGFNSVKLLSYSGSKLAEEQNEFYKKLAEINKPILALDSTIVKETDTMQLQKLNIEKKKFLITSAEFYKNWITNHNSSPFSVLIIKYYMQYTYPNADVLEKFYKNLFQVAKQNNLLADGMPYFFAELRKNEALKKGEKIKDFILFDTAANAHSFYNLIGDNYVLLDIWASWCEPCRKSNPEIKKILGIYSNRNFKVISISADTEGEKWKTAIKEDTMHWQQLSDLKGTDAGFMKSNYINSYPTYLLISPKGIIIATPWDINRVKEAVDEIFANSNNN